MKQYVEFYFPGISLMGSNEKEVKLRDVEEAKPFPMYSNAFRFFEKDEAGNKINFSNFYYIGKEYSKQQYLLAYPQGEDIDSNRIIKLVTGGFKALNENDIVV
ncbi:MAG: hypothetical protein J6M60_05925 [Clostridia bacterium]|nr:hypothetical protein [Clostridia bacterium]